MNFAFSCITIIIIVGLCSCIILCEPSPPYRGSGDHHVTVSPDLSCADSCCVLCAKTIYRVVNCSKVSMNIELRELSAGIATTLALRHGLIHHNTINGCTQFVTIKTHLQVATLPPLTCMYAVH